MLRNDVPLSNLLTTAETSPNLTILCQHQLKRAKSNIQKIQPLFDHHVKSKFSNIISYILLYLEVD